MNDKINQMNTLITKTNETIAEQKKIIDANKKAIDFFDSVLGDMVGDTGWVDISYQLI
jgi:hypothetical protein